MTLRIDAFGVDATATSTVHYVLALCLVTVALGVFASVRSGELGLSLATWRQNADAARAIGLGHPRPRVQAFVISAAVAGTAGALAVQLAGVFDAGSYGPILTVTLFVAVLVGGMGSTFGPIIGVAVVSLVSPTGPSTLTLSPTIARYGQLLVGALLLGAVIVARNRSAEPKEVRAEPEAPPTPRVPTRRVAGSESLRAEGLTKSYGGVTALDAVDVSFATGKIHALVGPNGSGKTTLLRALSGDLVPDRGQVWLGETDISKLGVRDRVRTGVVRTLQRTAVFPDLTTERHGEAALVAHGNGTGLFRDLLKTPSARAKAKELRSRARATLAAFRFEDPTMVAATLPASQQRFLMVAMAAASNPAFVLLDEPSAGMSAADKERLRELLRELASNGMGVVVVEHDLRLLRALADVATVLEAGRVIAVGPPDRVLRDPAVVSAYLGRLRGDSD
jgi:branched-chain amino acid transport system permease protein